MNTPRWIATLLHRLGDRRARRNNRDFAAGLERALLPNSRQQNMKALLQRSEQAAVKAAKDAA